MEERKKLISRILRNDPFSDEMMEKAYAVRRAEMIESVKLLETLTIFCRKRNTRSIDKVIQDKYHCEELNLVVWLKGKN